MNQLPALEGHMLPLSENALDELVAQERERAAPPLTDWNSLSARLRAEGLIQGRGGSRFISRGWLQIAAGLMLAVGGAAVGRMSAGYPSTAANDSQTASGNVAPVSASQVTEPADQSPSGTLASVGTAQFESPEAAWEVLNRAGEEYQRASSYLSANNSEIPMPANPSQYRTRLAALDNVMSEIRGALKEAPQDPVINQYYLATVGAREATLRQLGATLRPAGVSLNRF
jgi:hypothetical protein